MMMMIDDDDSGQVIHMHLPLSMGSVIWFRPDSYIALANNFKSWTDSDSFWAYCLSFCLISYMPIIVMQLPGRQYCLWHLPDFSEDMAPSVRCVHEK